VTSSQNDLTDRGADGEALLDLTTLRLLADPLRARIVELLSTEVLCTSHLVEITGAGQTNISNHLRVLREAGLVTTEPCGRFTYNRLVPGPLTQLAGQLDGVAAAARTELPRRACP
jgi:ArsR family transcriptional regulator